MFLSLFNFDFEKIPFYFVTLLFQFSGMTIEREKVEKEREQTLLRESARDSKRETLDRVFKDQSTFHFTTSTTTTTISPPAAPVDFNFLRLNA